jgi:hypothetical protein
MSFEMDLLCRRTVELFGALLTGVAEAMGTTVNEKIFW